MSLNNIQLSPHLLVGLYAHVLVETTATNMPPEKAIEFLGGNQKNILIVVANKEAGFLPDNELSFLTNILAACKLGLPDVAIINKEQLQDKNYSGIIASMHSKSVLLFGVEPLAFGLPIHFPHFQIQPFNNCTYLTAPPLPAIEQDKLLKSKLWAGLKTLFCL